MKPAFRNSNIFTLIIVSLLSGASQLHGVLVNWTNTGTGDFATAANWSPNQVPDVPDFARLTNGGTITISDGLTHTVSNLWVAARNFNNATGTVRITSGTLSVPGIGSAANRPQVGIGVNALGIIEVNGGTFERGQANFIYFGGNGGQGFLNLSNGNVFIDTMRTGSDNDNNTTGGIGYVNVSGGLMVVTNQWTVGQGRESGIVNVTGGLAINHALNNFLGTQTDDFLTIAGGNNSTGSVTVASGGILRAEGGIRMGQASAAGEIADARLRVAGGRLVTQRIFQGATSGTSIPNVEFDGGVLEAYAATNANGFMYFGLIVKLKAGGIAIDSTGHDLRVTPAFLEDATSPGGGVIKSNAGVLRLLGANTYTGPTVIEGGLLLLTTSSTGGGGVTANDGSSLAVMIASAGSSLNTSALALNPGSGTNELNFDLGSFGNPSVPVITATNLAVNRTNKVNLTGAGFSIGQFTLIAFTTGSGVAADRFELGTLPAGVSAQFIVEPNAVKLDITAAPSLHWNGNLSSDWDTNTANWLDVSGVPTPAVYSDGGAVLFDDAATTNFVNLVQALLPARVTVTNQTLNYTLTGTGFISGASSLLKQGNAILTLATTNNYSGDTTVSAGTLQLGASEVIPHGASRGNLVLNGILDLNGFNETVNGLSGGGTIDNLSFAACQLTAGNSAGMGTFSGLVTNSGGVPLTFRKAGISVFTLNGPLAQSGGVIVDGGTLLVTSANNPYSGGTTLSSGTLRVGAENALGTGLITMTTANTTLTPDGATPRTITNDLAINFNSTFGSVGAGELTLSGNIDFTAGNRNLTFNSDVVWSGATAGNGTIDDKLGVGTLTLRNIVADFSGSAAIEIRNGAVILDGAQVTKSAEAVRVMSELANGTAYLLITNNGSLTLLSSGSNLRVGYDNANGSTSTNIAEVYGSVHILGTGSGGGQIQLGAICQRAVLYARNGSLLEVKGITHAFNAAAPNAFSEANFDGTTLRATLDTTSFMQGLSNAFVHAGGVTVDTTNYTVTLAQDLLAGTGAGGLTKIGDGTLFLNGTNTYTGSTIVSNGALGGIGTINSPVLVTSGGTLAPGSPVGTLTVNNTVTLQGNVLTALSRDSGAAASGLLNATSALVYAGSLTVTNIGNAALQSGDVFNLFDAPALSGGFSSVSLPTLLAGLSWQTNNLSVDGSISITGTVIPPQFNPPVIVDTNLNLSGIGGPAGGTYYVLTSTNVADAVSNWTVLATNTFDGSGNFSFSDALDPAVPQRFYLISIQ
jgi:autotransporter-associated beta strand protein